MEGVDLRVVSEWGEIERCVVWESLWVKIRPEPRKEPSKDHPEEMGTGRGLPKRVRREARRQGDGGSRQGPWASGASGLLE